jgi:hypothetical protein
VVIDCLIEALDTDAVGMWGCTSPNERIEIQGMINGDEEEGINPKSLKKAVESLWDEQRKKGKRGMLVPKKSVWKDWDA